MAQYNTGKQMDLDGPRWTSMLLRFKTPADALGSRSRFASCGSDSNPGVYQVDHIIYTYIYMVLNS